MLSIDTTMRICRSLFRLLPALAWCCSLSANTFTVNTTGDVSDYIPGNGICSDKAVNGKCSLRAAVQEANALSGVDTINLGQSVYTLTIAGSQEDNAATGDLDITDDLTLVGVAATTTIIDGNKLDRVFDIRNNSTVVIRNVTLRNGFTTDVGGAISLDQQSSMNISNCNITNNETGNYGGGIYSANSNFVIDQCDFDTNMSGGFGGGVYIDAVSSAVISKTTFKYNNSGFGSALCALGITTTVTDSLFFKNKSDNAGAIVTGATKSILYLTNSTISGNISDVSAAAIFMFTGSAIYMRNSTVANNEAKLQVGGIISNGSLFVANSIIASNNIASNGTKPNCLGIINSQGYNLMGDNSGCNFISSEGDQTGTKLIPINALLAPLADNGGPTLTHALLADSPAIDAGTPRQPGSGGSACELTDQRGVLRIRPGVCDIGAFETTSGGDAWVTVKNAIDVTPGYDLIQQDIVVGNKGPNKVSNLVLSINLPVGSQNIISTGDGWLCTPTDNTIQCNRAAINRQSESPLLLQFTPPADKKEIITEASIATASDDPIDSNNQQKLTTILNTAPVVTTTAVIEYKTHKNSARIAPQATIVDDDDTMLNGAQIQISNGYQADQDNLYWHGSAYIKSQWQPQIATLILTGEDSVAAYEQALREVIYENRATTVNIKSRGITITINDAHEDSAPAGVTIRITESVNTDSTNVSNVSADTDANPFTTHDNNSQSNNLTDTDHAHTADTIGQASNQTSHWLLMWFQRIRDTASNDPETLAQTGWASIQPKNNEEAWLTLENIAADQGDSRHDRDAAAISASAVFIVGAINLYMRAGGFIGLLFSLPLWTHIDPVPILLLTQAERQRRKKESQKLRRRENKDGRLSSVLDANQSDGTNET